MIDQTAFQTGFQKGIPVPPPGELVITPETLERLKVPDDVLLRPESVNPFMAGQWVKLNDIVNKPEIKALSADIPEYLHEEAFNAYPSAISPEEKGALASWYGEHRAKLQVQSGSTQDEQLQREIDSYIDGIKKSHPELIGSKGGPSVDPLDSMLMNKFQETEDEKKKFWEALAAAHGNPESVNTILGWRFAHQVSKTLGKLVESYKFQLDAKDKMLAEFDLANKKGPMTAADLAGFNAKLATMQTDSSVLFNVIQKYTSDLERVTAETSRTNTEIARPLQLMIQNMRT